MASVNKVIIVGNVGRDPELRYTQSGQPVASFSIATNERFKDRDGNWKDRTEWHRIVAWARLAEICGEYLRKGSQVYVEGRIQTRDWEDKEGNKRQTTEIVALSMQMLGRRGEGGGPMGGSDDSQARGGGDDPLSQAGGGGGGGADDEIPF
ncbi:MAG TPA: single-stranded DNA-binding protein [Myxococcota bacterium]|nr:single-stranded DNA-binding protein [Myxococcota bacterium]